MCCSCHTHPHTPPTTTFTTPLNPRILSITNSVRAAEIGLELVLLSVGGGNTRRVLSISLSVKAKRISQKRNYQHGVLFHVKMLSLDFVQLSPCLSWANSLNMLSLDSWSHYSCCGWASGGKRVGEYSCSNARGDSTLFSSRQRCFVVVARLQQTVV